MKYGFSKVVDLPFDRTVERVTEGLREEGFGVLTTIDVKDTLKRKLGVDFKRYVILGACNPALAHKALQAEEEIGLLLPCNVIVYEKNGKTGVALFDPAVMTRIIDSPAVSAIAGEVGGKLRQVFERL
jgi:uncharacterized protein (DUF302 family)